jgi:hypothetical protein
MAQQIENPKPSFIRHGLEHLSQLLHGSPKQLWVFG